MGLLGGLFVVFVVTLASAATSVARGTLAAMHLQTEPFISMQLHIYINPLPWPQLLYLIDDLIVYLKPSLTWINWF